MKMDNKQFDAKLIPHYIKSHAQSLSHANPQYHPRPHIDSDSHDYLPFLFCQHSLHDEG